MNPPKGGIWYSKRRFGRGLALGVGDLEELGLGIEPLLVPLVVIVVPGPLMRLSKLAVELPPLLLRPAELLDGRGEVQEVHGNDRGSRAQVSVPYQGVQLAPGLGEAVADSAQAFTLLGGVAAVVGQPGLLG